MLIAVVTVDGDTQQALNAEIEAIGHEAAVFDNLLQALAAEPKLVFAQWAIGERLPDFLKGLRAASAVTPPVPVVVLVPPGAVTLMKRARSAGAADALFFPPDPEEIRAEIEDAFSIEDAVNISHQQKFRELRRQKLIGECPNFLKCLEELKLAAKSDANVLIIGETGTGKEVLAQTIHDISRRCGDPYIPVNCASLPGALLETELFGHTRGAFTGAQTERAGRFEVVGTGTLLLDEIGDIEIGLQTKLLRVIEQRVFQRVGENKNRRFNARLICATSVNLDTAVGEGRFRRDLLGRIDQFRIVLPSLHDRRADIPILTYHFLLKHSKGRQVEISKTAMELLEAFDYPMNIRQLENAVIGALARSDPGRLILPKHLPDEIVTAKTRTEGKSYRTIRLPAELSYKNARKYAEQSVDNLYLSELLNKHAGNHTHAAEEAGIDRKTFGERLHQSFHNREGEPDD